MGQRVHGIELLVGVLHLGVQLFGAQAQHAHEQKHVEGGRDLERMQRPEIDGQRPIDHTDDGCRAQAVYKPRYQQGGANAVARACAPPSARQAEQGGQRAHDADDGGQPLQRDQVKGKRHPQPHGEQGAPPHAAQEAALRVVPLQGLAHEQKAARDGHQRCQPHGMARQPGAVAPQILLAHAKKVQGIEQAAAGEQRVLDEQRLAQAVPLRHAVEDEAQRQAGQHALQHLLVHGPAQNAGGRVERDGQNHRAPGLHPQQEFVVLACFQLKRLGGRAAGQGPLGPRHFCAQHAALQHLSALQQQHINAIEVGVVDFKHPPAVGCGVHRQGDVQPHGILAHSQRGIFGGLLKLVQPGQRLFGGQRQLLIDQKPQAGQAATVLSASRSSSGPAACTGPRCAIHSIQTAAIPMHQRTAAARGPRPVSQWLIS